MVMKKSRAMFLAIPVVLLFAGCDQQVIVVDGDCKPIQGAEIYHLEEGVLLLKPWGPFYTNQEGIAKLRPNSISITISKEGYKPATIEESFDWPLRVFLYKETEEYESGLTDWKKCMEDH